MPDEEPVVWPDDPVDGDGSTGDAEPAKSANSDWPASFEEALKQAQAIQEPAAAAPAPAPAIAPTNEYPTQPSMPAIPAKTVPPQPAAAPEVAKTAPPEPAPTEESVAALGMADEAPTSTFKTPIPAPAEASAANGGDAAAKVVVAAEPGAEAEVEAEVAEEPEARAGDPDVEATAEPAPEPDAAEPEHGAEPELEPVAAEAEPEPEPTPEPEPVVAAAPAPGPEGRPEPEKASEPEPVRAAEPEPAPKEEEWIPLPVNPPLPSWAPAMGTPPEAPHPVRFRGEAVAPNVPSWAPSTSSMPAASRQATSPAMPAQNARPQPPAPPAAPAPGGSKPPEPAKSKTSSWEIVPPKQTEQQKQAYAGPLPEDKSYAEWFAWAKRSGAPASACHAAAQGAFRALAAGHDMNTAVQWATLAMASPPGLVSAPRQLYCAWYSLGNIDLRLPSPQAHAFATGAIGALEGGADAPTAHQAGLAAAGITG